MPPIFVLITAAVTLSACKTDDSKSAAELVPDADAPPVTAPAGTPLHHAQTCAQYLGPIPAMSCSDADIMPITVDGVEASSTPASCDRPSALTGTCETGERIAARYTGTHHDGTPRPEVVFVNFCRDGGMGVIGHNAETGATCFFHINMQHDNTARHPGSADPDYDDYWQTAAVVAADNCQGCHQADPWLHSPWIDQLKDPAIRPSPSCRSPLQWTRPTPWWGRALLSRTTKALQTIPARAATAHSVTPTSPYPSESW